MTFSSTRYVAVVAVGYLAAVACSQPSATTEGAEKSVEAWIDGMATGDAADVCELEGGGFQEKINKAFGFETCEQRVADFEQFLFYLPAEYRESILAADYRASMNGASAADVVVTVSRGDRESLQSYSLMFRENHWIIVDGDFDRERLLLAD